MRKEMLEERVYATRYSENVKPVSESNTASVFAAVAGSADAVLMSAEYLRWKS